ncbi:unnamed protein product [Calicophoron daubneyi]|uniref:PWWP domain-containing protein n=1 Tax=Calicophoron daubneyi TaxID=300641 RepID=A0AAV2TCZ4_CALDB
MTFQPGDRVFAKIKGFSNWPARINPLPSEVPVPKGKLPVFFYGTYQVSFVAVKNIVPFEKFKEKWGKPKSNLQFMTAMNEIETNPGIFMLGEDPRAESFLHQFYKFKMTDRGPMNMIQNSSKTDRNDEADDSSVSRGSPSSTKQSGNINKKSRNTSRSRQTHSRKSPNAGRRRRIPPSEASSEVSSVVSKQDNLGMNDYDDDGVSEDDNTIETGTKQSSRDDTSPSLDRLSNDDESRETFVDQMHDRQDVSCSPLDADSREARHLARKLQKKAEKRAAKKAAKREARRLAKEAERAKRRARREAKRELKRLHKLEKQRYLEQEGMEISSGTELLNETTSEGQVGREWTSHTAAAAYEEVLGTDTVHGDQLSPNMEMHFDEFIDAELHGGSITPTSEDRPTSPLRFDEFEHPDMYGKETGNEDNFSEVSDHLQSHPADVEAHSSPKTPPGTPNRKRSLSTDETKVDVKQMSETEEVEEENEIPLPRKRSRPDMEHLAGNKLAGQVDVKREDTKRGTHDDDQPKRETDLTSPSSEEEMVERKTKSKKQKSQASAKGRSNGKFRRLLESSSSEAEEEGGNEVGGREGKNDLHPISTPEEKHHHSTKQHEVDDKDPHHHSSISAVDLPKSTVKENGMNKYGSSLVEKKESTLADSPVADLTKQKTGNTEKQSKKKQKNKSVSSPDGESGPKGRKSGTPEGPATEGPVDVVSQLRRLCHDLKASLVRGHENFTMAVQHLKQLATIPARLPQLAQAWDLMDSIKKCRRYKLSAEVRDAAHMTLRAFQAIQGSATKEELAQAQAFVAAYQKRVTSSNLDSGQKLPGPPVKTADSHIDLTKLKEIEVPVNSSKNSSPEVKAATDSTSFDAASKAADDVASLSADLTAKVDDVLSRIRATEERMAAAAAASSRTEQLGRTPLGGSFNTATSSGFPGVVDVSYSSGHTIRASAVAAAAAHMRDEEDEESVMSRIEQVAAYEAAARLMSSTPSAQQIPPPPPPPPPPPLIPSQTSESFEQPSSKPVSSPPSVDLDLDSRIELLMTGPSAAKTGTGSKLKTVITPDSDIRASRSTRCSTSLPGISVDQPDAAGDGGSAISASVLSKRQIIANKLLAAKSSHLSSLKKLAGTTATSENLSIKGVAKQSTSSTSNNPSSKDDELYDLLGV